MVMDQTTDPNGQTLHRLTRLYEPPEFVKVATHEQITGMGRDLPPESFADPRTMQFPTHTPAAVVTSAMYLLEAAPGLGKLAEAVRQRVDRAAEYFGVKGHVDRIREKAAAATAVGADPVDDADYAFVAVYEGGAKDRHLPLRNAAEVKAAAAWLGQWKGEFVYDDRRTIAEKILRKAAALGGLEPAEEQALFKQAGWACGSGEKAAEAVFARAHALRVLRKDLDDQEKLAELAVTLAENPQIAHDPAAMQKVASILDETDRQYGLAGLGAPEDLFEFTVKEAEDFLGETVELVTGSIYKKADLADVDLAGLRDVLGDAFAERVSTAGLFLDVEKLAEEARTLPRGDAALFDRLAAQAEIAPLEKVAAAQDNDLFGAALAALHQS